MKRKIRRTKNHQIFKTIVCTACLTALVCFGIFCIGRYLESREQEENVDNETPTETISVAEYQNIENSDQTEDKTKKTEKAENQTEKKDDTIEEDTKAAAEAASQQKEIAKNDNGLKVAEPKVSAYSLKTTDGSLSGSEKFEDLGFDGYIPNILDEEGTCTFVFSNGAKTFSKETGILPNAKYAVCDLGMLMLAPNELSAGEWTVQLKYKSKYAEGESEKEKFKIN